METITMKDREEARASVHYYIRRCEDCSKEEPASVDTVFNAVTEWEERTFKKFSNNNNDRAGYLRTVENKKNVALKVIQESINQSLKSTGDKVIEYTLRMFRVIHTFYSKSLDVYKQKCLETLDNLRKSLKLNDEIVIQKHIIEVFRLYECIRPLISDVLKKLRMNNLDEAIKQLEKSPFGLLEKVIENGDSIDTKRLKKASILLGGRQYIKRTKITN